MLQRSLARNIWNPCQQGICLFCTSWFFEIRARNRSFVKLAIEYSRATSLAMVGELVVHRSRASPEWRLFRWLCGPRNVRGEPPLLGAMVITTLGGTAGVRRLPRGRKMVRCSSMAQAIDCHRPCGEQQNVPLILEWLQGKARQGDL